jgi:putative hydrolase of the HAD superfamily
VAVLSDYPVKNKLAYLGLDNLWDCALSSEEACYLKPHIAPFRYVAAKLQEPPEQILYVGDIYEYDIAGAHNAGMKAAYFTPFAPAAQKSASRLADLEFSNYHAFYRLLVKKFCFNKCFAI